MRKAIVTASEEAQKWIDQQLQLPRKPPAISSYHLAGADVAARQRVFDAGQALVSKVLTQTELQPWEVEGKLEEARAEIMDRISSSGFFRTDVSCWS